MKLTGKVNEDNRPLSLSSQDFKRFWRANLWSRLTYPWTSRESRSSKFKDYLALQRTSKFVSILNKHGKGIPSFLTWFDYTKKKNNVKPDDIVRAIEYLKNMQSMQQQKEDLENEIGSLESERDFVVENIAGLKKKLSRQAQ
jgi:hypothetical protein